jgi:hypothetical protein
MIKVTRHRVYILHCNQTLLTSDHRFGFDYGLSSISSEYSKMEGIEANLKSTWFEGRFAGEFHSPSVALWKKNEPLEGCVCNTGEYGMKMTDDFAVP